MRGRKGLAGAEAGSAGGRLWSEHVGGAPGCEAPGGSWQEVDISELRIGQRVHVQRCCTEHKVVYVVEGG